MKTIRLTALKAHATLSALLAVVALSGCGSMSGYDAESEFKCKAPAGVQCQSMSGVYANRKGAPEPEKTTGQSGNANPIPYSQLTTPAARNMGAGQAPTYWGAIRAEPTTLRTWVMAYRDTDGDVVDQLYVYMATDSGRWLIEHNEQTIRDNFAPARPVKGPNRVNLGLKKEVSPPASSEANEASSTRFGLEKPDGSDNSGSGKSAGNDTATVIRQLQESMKSANGVATRPQEQH